MGPERDRDRDRDTPQRDQVSMRSLVPVCECVCEWVCCDFYTRLSNCVNCNLRLRVCSFLCCALISQKKVAPKIKQIKFQTWQIVRNNAIEVSHWAVKPKDSSSAFPRSQLIDGRHSNDCQIGRQWDSDGMRVQRKWTLQWQASKELCKLYKGSLQT